MKNRLSYTAIEKYKTCPKSYFFYYVAKLREVKLASPLIFGGTFDNSLNSLLKGEVDYLKKFRDQWETYLDNKDVKYNKSDLDESLLNDKENTYNDQFRSWLSMKRKGEMMLEAYKEQVLPNIKEILAVQKFFKLQTEEGDALIGYIDLICKWMDDRILICDNKTSGSKYEESSVRESIQLANYLEAESENYENTRNAAFIVVPKSVRKLKEPRVPIQIIIDEVPMEFQQEVAAKNNEVNDLIKDGEFPRNLSSCMGKYGKCTYYNLCHNGSTEGLVDMSKEIEDERK